jgi:CO/xanthine dehydrogenase Mo-binding subunit
VPRVEDAALLTGQVEFIDDLTLPGMLHCAILRSPHAHAGIEAIRSKAAEEMPGVVAVLTGEDVRRWTQPSTSYPPGSGLHCMATEKVHYVGEPVAAVAAASRPLAEDALERIEVDYAPRPTVAEAREAMRPDSPRVIDSMESNVALQKILTWGDVESAFEAADHVFSESFRWNRVGANPMETFGTICQWHVLDGSATCRGSIQAPKLTGLGVSQVLGIASNKFRVISHPRGGSFGGKGNPRGIAIATLLSRKVGGRPVKWIEDRMEYLIAGASQSWDRHYRASLAVRRDGTVTGLRVALVDDIGASGESFGAVGAGKPLSCFTGCYAIPVAEYDLSIVLTHKLPTSAYRGMGPPPHTMVLERLMDIAARGLGIDPAELRRRNYIQPDRFPYVIPSGNEYDSGDYKAALDKVLEMADYGRLRAEQVVAREEGRLLGIGVANGIEPDVFDWNAYAIVGVEGVGQPEGVTVSIDVYGAITARVGFTSEGQGQYTLVAQLLADYFGTELGDVSVVPLDSASAPPHFGPGESRLGVALTGAVLGACAKLERKLTAIAAGLLQVEAEQVELHDGQLRVKAAPPAALPLAQVAGVAHARSDLLPPGMEPGLDATHVWTAPERGPIDEQGRAKSYLTAANACHLVQVEIDRDTGQTRILRYVIVDDCGTRLNPATVEGMTQGGVAQDLIPTIHEVPMTEKAALCTPSPVAPLGAKGWGAGGIDTTPAAVLCAINDALAPLGVLAREVPASPQRLWKLIRTAEEQRRGA